jgi:hypothetical protein
MYTNYYLILCFPYIWKFGIQVLYIYLRAFTVFQFDLWIQVLQYICHFSSPKISVDTHSTFILYSSTPPFSAFSSLAYSCNQEQLLYDDVTYRRGQSASVGNDSTMMRHQEQLLYDGVTSRRGEIASGGNDSMMMRH